jgi:hypothetical protein
MMFSVSYYLELQDATIVYYASHLLPTIELTWLNWLNWLNWLSGHYRTLTSLLGKNVHQW